MHRYIILNFVHANLFNYSNTYFTNYYLKELPHEQEK